MATTSLAEKLKAGYAKAFAPKQGEPDGTEVLIGIAEALRQIVGSHIEVVVHDLRVPEKSVVHIVNGHVSGRRRGHPIIAGLAEDEGFRGIIAGSNPADANVVRVIGSYLSSSRDGRGLRSSSVIIHDKDGRATSALCFNVDPGPVERVAQELDRLLMPANGDDEDEAGGAITTEELILEIMNTAIQPPGVDVKRMSKAEKLEAVRKMHARGLFMMRGSVERVAKQLKTTKFTIYNYLEELGVK
ncbi:transcriptional regulator [Sphingosinicella sp.]|uniref:helix-turn-helix transcriptional regulator n=1 Tax=Sphingosinicella sp. TaxID=1917971 RepID=UPI0035AE8F0D